MTSLPVDAPAVGAHPSRERDESPEAVAQWDVWRTALLWLAVIVLLTTNAAFDVAQLESARAPGVRWWTIWLVSTREGVVASAFLFAAMRLSKRFTIDRAHLRWLGV